MISLRWCIHPRGHLLAQFIINNARRQTVYHARRRFLMPSYVYIQDSSRLQNLAVLYEAGTSCQIRQKGKVVAEISQKISEPTLTFQITGFSWQARNISSPLSANFAFEIRNQNHRVLAYLFKDEQHNFQLNIQSEQVDTLNLTCVAIALILMGKKKQRIRRFQYVTN